MTTTTARTASTAIATASDRPLPAHVRVAVVGSGFSGLGTAVRLL